MESHTRSKRKGNQESSVPTNQVTILPASRLLIHCPADLLKLIFEAIPSRHNDPDLNFRQANSLSAVCHTWRMVALETPRIWCDIGLRMGPSDRGWEEHWARTVERVKKVPVKIQIRNLCVEHPNDLSRFIQEASLTIDSLHLEFEHPDDINSLAKIWGEFRIHVKDLSISTHAFPRYDTVCRDKHREGGWYNGLDFGVFSKSVHCLRNFSFKGSGIGDSIIFPGAANTPIVQLHLQRLFRVNIIEICRIFPTLEGLDFHNCRFKPIPAETCIPQLRSIRFDSCVIDWLATIHFLRLECLSYDWCSFPQLNRFLARHQTVTTLSIDNVTGVYGIKDIQSTVGTANRVLFLTLHSKWAACLTADHAFSSLCSLTIVDARHLDVVTFDLLVKGRCLPLSHPKSEAKSPSRILNEFFIEEGEDWLCKSSLIKSHWYIQATKEVERRPESSVVKVKLAWPIHSGSSS
jgi:hypothetical protein